MSDILAAYFYFAAAATVAGCLGFLLGRMTKEGRT